MKNRARHFLAFCAAASVVVAAGSVIAAGTDVPVVSSSDQPGTSQVVELPAAPVFVQLPAPPARPAALIEVEVLRPIVADIPAVAETPVRTAPVAYATGQIAAVQAQPFTRPPAFVPKKPRGS